VGRVGSFVWSVLLVCAAACAVAAPAAAADYSKSSYRIPVTAPDEFGAPVTIEADVYLPDGKPPASGWPLVQVLHGGGSNKDNEYDAGHARGLAEEGFAAILYSQRGHGDSTGQLVVAGPKEMRDLFDVTAWALGIAGFGPAHPDFHLDANRIAAMGNSQGGLNTNMAQISSFDPDLDPYGIRFRALLPQDTPDVVFDALVPNNVVKLSFGVGLLGTYTVTGDTQGRIAPAVARWIGTAALDQSALYGGEVCDSSGHDAPSSTMKQDLAARSVGCFIDSYTTPFLWTQALDDNLFPGDMAISMWRRSPAPEKRLYLSMGGHGAPFPHPSNEEDEFAAGLALLKHELRGRPLDLPAVTYWTRDPLIALPSDQYRYPRDAWVEQTASDWPPPGVTDIRYRLGADGRAVEQGPVADGPLPLAPTSPDPGGDPVVNTAFAQTPLGTSPSHALSPSSISSPGAVAGFVTDPFDGDQELSGNVVAQLAWTPLSSDTQLVLKVLDMAPDGTLTLLNRGVQGLRGVPIGVERSVTVRSDALSSLIPAGHRVLIWVSAGDASFYKLYPGSLGGVLQAGESSTATLPLRQAQIGGGGRCANEIGGTKHRDDLDGTPAGDRIRARRGNDRVSGLDGDDCIKGGPGRDRLKGNDDDDQISAGPGGDHLSGGDGRDRLKARAGGRDVLRCGKGRDTAIVDARDRVRGCERVHRRHH
jgi:predicted acyl esterase